MTSSRVARGFTGMLLLVAGAARSATPRAGPQMPPGPELRQYCCAGDDTISRAATDVDAGPPGRRHASKAQAQAEKPGIVRTYYIAADEVDWDYTPKGRNITGLPHVESADDESGAGIQHRIYHKAHLSRIHRCDLQDAENPNSGVGASRDTGTADSRRGWGLHPDLSSRTTLTFRYTHACAWT